MASETDQERSPLWQFVALDHYQTPSAPVAYAAKKGVEFFRRLFRQDEPEPESPFELEGELCTLPEWQLERVAPAIEWADAADAFGAEVKDWLDQEKPSPPVVVLVGPPHSGHSELLRAWAQKQGWSTIAPPSAEQILAGDDSWFSEQWDGDAPWVFPVLEKTYLRHEAGLDLIRRFLDQAHAGHLGRGVIGCDSWAWAFLRHVWHGRRSVTLALQAFDKERLSALFRRSADSRSQVGLFRQSDNGHYVLPPPDGEQKPDEMSTFIKLLAAHSRGILGIARAVWRDSLRTEPDEWPEEESESDEGVFSGHTIWVSAWDSSQHPSLPSGAGRDEAFVLHGVLLHGGLPDDVLTEIVPLSTNQVMETLSRLEEAGLVGNEEGVWRVLPRGYPAARQFLQASGYLVDPC